MILFIFLFFTYSEEKQWCFSLNNLFEWTSRNLSVYPFRIHGISFRQLLFNENKKIK